MLYQRLKATCDVSHKLNNYVEKHNYSLYRRFGIVASLSQIMKYTHRVMLSDSDVSVLGSHIAYRQSPLINLPTRHSRGSVMH